MHLKPDKSVQQRSHYLVQMTPERLTELYRDLTKATTHSAHCCKVVYVSELTRMRMAKHCLKESSEDNYKGFVGDLEEQHNSKLQEVEKIDNIMTMNRHVLDNIKSMRSHTEAVIQQTLRRCQSLSQQIGQPVKRVDELCLMEKKMAEIMEEIRR